MDLDVTAFPQIARIILKRDAAFRPNLDIPRRLCRRHRGEARLDLIQSAPNEGPGGPRESTAL